MTRCPSPEDYIRAVQHPGEAFRADDLRAAEFALDPVWRIPMSASGTAAVVFRATVGGTDRALRFFTREDVSDRKRYDAVASHVAATGLTGDVAAAVWRDGAVRIGEADWPVVDMQWVEGRSLDVYVDDLVLRDDRGSLRELARQWRSLVRRLQEARFAHGDLQHGNVLIDTSGSLRLVDLDGAWTPDLAGQIPPTETGHPNYQHTDRVWGRWMDTFPGLLVYTSLVAVAARPSLWSDYAGDENLLFTAADLRPPFHTPLWRELRAAGDAELNRLAFQLVRCCTPGGLPEVGLDALISETRVSSGSTTAGGVPWWQKIEAGSSTADATTGTRLPPPPPKTEEPVTVSSAAGLGPPPTPTANWFAQKTTAEPETVVEETGTARRPLTAHVVASLLAGAVTAVLIWLLVTVTTGAPLSLAVDHGAVAAALTGGPLSVVLVFMILRRPG